MGALVLAAKFTHVPSLMLSEVKFCEYFSSSGSSQVNVEFQVDG